MHFETRLLCSGSLGVTVTCTYAVAPWHNGPSCLGSDLKFVWSTLKVLSVFDIDYASRNLPKGNRNAIKDCG
jgi:hypothetical protein